MIANERNRPASLACTETVCTTGLHQLAAWQAAASLSLATCPLYLYVWREGSVFLICHSAFVCLEMQRYVCMKL